LATSFKKMFMDFIGFCFENLFFLIFHCQGPSLFSRFFILLFHFFLVKCLIFSHYFASFSFFLDMVLCFFSIL
jgi:hypothetical protein